MSKDTCDLMGTLPWTRCSPASIYTKTRTIYQNQSPLMAGTFIYNYVDMYVLKAYDTYDDFLQDEYSHLSTVIISIGYVNLILALACCCAYICEFKVQLGKLMVIILMIFVAEVAAFVLGCIYRGKIKTDVHEPMVHKFMVYDGESGESSAIDNLQRELQCCGIVNYTDWIGSQWYNSSGKNNSVPLSCCKIDVSKNCTGWLSQTKILNTQGCEDKVKSVLQRALIYTMVIILIFANVKFFGMLSIFLVACKRKSDGFQPLNSEDLACQNDGQ